MVLVIYDSFGVFFRNLGICDYCFFYNKNFFVIEIKVKWGELDV